MNCWCDHGKKRGKLKYCQVMKFGTADENINIDSKNDNSLSFNTRYSVVKI